MLPALNRAFQGGRIASDTACRKVKPFARVEMLVIRYLSADEARRFGVACTRARRVPKVGVTCGQLHTNKLIMLRLAGGHRHK
jgi:hypothetical protein